jgi:hypothetical protein
MKPGLRINTGIPKTNIFFSKFWWKVQWLKEKKQVITWIHFLNLTFIVIINKKLSFRPVCNCGNSICNHMDVLEGNFLHLVICNILLHYFKVFLLTLWVSHCLLTYLFCCVSYILSCSLSIVICVCLLCCFCNWPSGCWLGTLINQNWIELNWIEFWQNIIKNTVILKTKYIYIYILIRPILVMFKLPHCLSE